MRFLTSRRTSWIVLLLAVVGVAAAFLLGRGADSDGAPTSGLPAHAESARVAALLEEFPEAETASAILVFTREDGDLTDDDVATIGERVPELAELATEEQVLPPIVAEDRSAAVVTVLLEPESDVAAQAARADELRAAASEGLPDGVTAVLTGPEGFEVDLAAVFEGADVTLLITTVIVVAVLLLLTYRSPVLWLVPLAVIGTADAVAGIVARRLAALAGYELDASVTGILSVLVFGAGTNYALLIIARYRDELRLHDDRRDAMRSALRGAAPAILASGGTVVLSLLTLLFAGLEGNRALGLACAIGVLLAMLFALAVLPAALLLFGRGLFWPYVPRVGTPSTAERSLWGRLGRGVARRPALVGVLGLLVLVGLASAVPRIETGLASTEQFREVPEAVVGQELIAEAFPAGSGAPTIVLADEDAVDDVIAAAEDVDRVDSVRPGDSDDGLARVDVVLDAEPESEAAFAAVEDLRAAVHAVEGADALVGGADATALDVSQVAAADQRLLLPLILGVVLLVLLVLLRALVAPVLLLLTVIASFFASLGAAWLLFAGPFGFSALDTNVILLSFLFLVALGVDYNIFLVTRAREEALRPDSASVRAGMVTALAATGGVITSAGVLLAAVFAVLGVLPLITLTQIGVIVCIGVLLDTLLVRTVLVPALAFLTGRGFWWPGRLSRR